MCHIFGRALAEHVLGRAQKKPKKTAEGSPVSDQVSPIFFLWPLFLKGGYTEGAQGYGPSRLLVGQSSTTWKLEWLLDCPLMILGGLLCCLLVSVPEVGWTIPPPPLILATGLLLQATASPSLLSGISRHKLFAGIKRYGKWHHDETGTKRLDFREIQQGSDSAGVGGE
jgi:hypothetical protein